MVGRTARWVANDPLGSRLENCTALLIFCCLPEEIYVVCKSAFFPSYLLILSRWRLEHYLHAKNVDFLVDTDRFILSLSYLSLPPLSVLTLLSFYLHLSLPLSPLSLSPSHSSSLSSPFVSIFLSLSIPLSAYLSVCLSDCLSPSFFMPLCISVSASK